VQLDRCRDCGLIFLGQTDAPDLESTYRDEDYVAAHDHFFEQDLALRHIAGQRVRWLSGKASAGTLLELGPGRGHLLDLARRAGFDPVGVEPSPQLAARISADFGIPVECGFLGEVELPRREFELICLYHVLEHVEDPGEMLRALRELLADDGLLVIEVPNIASAMARRRGDSWPAVQPRELHVSHFTPATLARLVERAGFGVVEVDTVAPWHYLPRRLRMRPRALMGHGYRSARLRTLRGTHPSGFDNLRLLASAA
jgi:2-polyprenyl-3-methyl-5-hydroxy-6-metoxy-1,4-benzoquinol methylase